MKNYMIEDMLKTGELKANYTTTYAIELKKGDTINIGSITKVEGKITYDRCYETFCSTPCGDILLSVPAIPDYGDRNKRHIMCRNHIHNYWGALEWWKQENNLERLTDLNTKDIKFRVK